LLAVNVADILSIIVIGAFSGEPERGIVPVFVFMGAEMLITERPSCPTCKHKMGLALISPGKRGFEMRTFECATCHRIEKVSFPIDPLKTDAVGWLASELRPPH
jgi:hypothetical protein